MAFKPKNPGALLLDIEPEEVLTPAAMTVRYCRTMGDEKVNLMVAKSLREDLEEIDVVGTDEQADAIVVGGGLGDGIASILVRTGKFTEEKFAESEIEPTAVIDSVNDLPALLT